MTPVQNPKFEMVTNENCCALLVDHQPGMFLNASDISLLALRNNSIALAKVLKLHKIPTVITCAAGGSGGPMGPLLPEIAEVFPDVQPVYRTKNNSWHDQKIRSAIEATGRKKIILAGITATSAQAFPRRAWRPRAMMFASSWMMHPGTIRQSSSIALSLT